MNNIKNQSIKGKLNIAGVVFIAVALIIIWILSLVKQGIENKLPDQNIVKRWTDGKDYAFVSLYFPEGSTVEQNELIQVRHSVDVGLKEISMVAENKSQRLYVDAFSERGQIGITNNNSSVQALAYGVTGDYFMFHPMNFVSGGPWIADNVMKDYVVIDERAAWTLFGATDVEGLSVYIAGVRHIVSGVIRVPEDSLSQAAGAVSNVIYMSQESLEKYGTVDTAVAYELLMPEPYEEYALDTLKKAYTGYEKTGDFIDNSRRFGIKNLYRVFKERDSIRMQTKSMSYPYWENVARYYEYKCMLITVWQLILLLATIVIFIAELVFAWKILKRIGIIPDKARVKRFVQDFDIKKYKRRIKKEKS